MKIVFTIGDCNGIGLEVFAKGLEILAKDDSFKKVDFSIIGHSETITEYFEKIGFDFQVSKNILNIKGFDIKIIPTSNYSKVEFGKETVDAGKLASESIEKAVSMVQSGDFDAMVTLPISKSVVHKAGWEFPGHTEMLAKRCNVKRPLMLLCSGDLRVGLVTVHEPISNVPNLINGDLIDEIATIFYKSLKIDFGINEPKIAVLGLNPHAGENGDIGKEEHDIIIPAMNNVIEKGIKLFGPFPADGFFAHREYLNYDGILAMYHDQGLIPLKLLAKGGGVNFTANLPIVRTSPDHGTAYSIAGKNRADGKSVSEAIKMAIMIAKNRTNHP